MNKFDIIKTIRLTEKATVLGEKNNEYVFNVDPLAEKPMIKRAVEEVFGKTVIGVRTCIYDGKKRNRGNSKPGRNINFKKAIVRLKEGERIDLV
jgi:large subunit ribosomal protein L23